MGYVTAPVVATIKCASAARENAPSSATLLRNPKCSPEHPNAPFLKNVTLSEGGAESRRANAQHPTPPSRSYVFRYD